MNALISDAATAGMLLVIGVGLRLLQPRWFDWRWLVIGVGLVWINGALLLRGYGLIPDVVRETWNWEGKILALAGTLAIAALPALGWRNAGLTLRQRLESWRAAIPVALIYCLIFVGFALAFPGDRPTREDVAFQLTMPGLEEEPFYRGLLLLTFDRAFLGRIPLFGVEWGWGAVLSCVAFGLAHAFGFGRHGFSFDAMTMALTALPSFIAVWLRYRTGSIALPVLVHNFGNAIGLLI